METNSYIEQPFRLSLNAAQLKLLAMACMLIDHIGAFLLPPTGAFYPICRTVGRLAFPIFCFLIAEGARHTRSLPNYMARLGLFALLSTPPYNWVHGEVWYACNKLNVFFTLLLGLAAIGCMQCLAPWLLQKAGAARLAQSSAACTAAALPFCIVLYAAAYALHTDYGGYGVAAIMVFWLLRERPLAAWSVFALMTFVSFDIALVRYSGYSGQRLAAYVSMNPYALIVNRVWKGGYVLSLQNARQIAAVLSMIPCALYNGQKGSGSRLLQYAFYAFYPIHLAVLWLLQLAIR